MQDPLPPPPNPHLPHGFPPGEPHAPPPLAGMVACCMCQRQTNPAQTYAPYSGWHICMDCLPQYRSMYPRQFRLPFFREGSRLLIAKDSQLPDFCVVCGAHGTHRRRKEFSWHEPWIILTVFAGLLVYIILALVLSKKGRLEFAYCDKHWRRRTIHIAAAWILAAVVPLAILFMAIAFDSKISYGMGWFLALAAVLSFFIGLVWGASALGVLKIAKIDEHYIHLKQLPSELEAQLHALAARTPLMVPWSAPPHAMPGVGQPVPQSPPRMS